MSDEKLRADLSFSDDHIALRAMDSFSRDSPLMQLAGWGFWPTLKHPEGWRWGIGRMMCGRIYLREEGSNYNFDALARAPGFMSVEMALREEFVAVCSRTTVILGNRYRWKYRGAFTPSFLVASTRLTNWFLDPTRWIFSGGMRRTRICFSPRIHLVRGSLYNSGHCA